MATLYYFGQIAKAVECLHIKYQIAHCDLKPQNILMSDDYKNIILCDFELAL